MQRTSDILFNLFEIPPDDREDAYLLVRSCRIEDFLKAHKEASMQGLTSHLEASGIRLCASREMWYLLGRVLSLGVLYGYLLKEKERYES